MISKNSVLQSVNTALTLAEHNCTVSPKPNTVLASLVRLTNESTVIGNVIQVYGDDNKVSNNSFLNSVSLSLDGYAEFIQGCSAGKLEGEALSVHDKTLQELGATLNKFILRHISFAKNVVKPLAGEYSTEVIKYMETYSRPDAASDFNIMVLDVPKPLLDASFLYLISVYDNRAAIEPKNNPKLGVKTLEEIVALMVTRDSVIDTDIAEWLSTKPNQDWLLNIWQSFFADFSEVKGLSNSLTTYYNINKLDTFDKLEYYLAIFLIANKLFTELDSGTEGISLVEYKNIIAEIRNYAGINITTALRFIKNYDVLKTIVISTDSDEKVARVYGINYRDWLANGGNIETIFGLIVNGSKASNKIMLDDIADDLLRDWNRYIMFTNSDNKSKTLEHFKTALDVCFKNLMSTLTDDEREFTDTANCYLEVANKYLSEQIKEINPKCLDNVYITCLKVLCRARFYYTDAEKILLDIHQTSLDNPGIDVREAALVAQINYIVDYVADQMYIVKDSA